MKNKIGFCIFITWVLTGCNNSKPYHVKETHNPTYVANTAFTSFEDLTLLVGVFTSQRKTQKCSNEK